MSSPAGEPQQELVIVRRRGAGDEGGGKGGVWKIAYADFMTAMMAFFLVMWLINAANEATRAQVASYFNPIKLTDSVSGNRGLSEPSNTQGKDKSYSKPAEDAKKDGKESKPTESKQEEESKKESGKAAGDTKERRFSEDELFKDPYVVLAQLAGQAAAGSPAGKAKSGAAADKTGHSGLKSGEAFRDPFDPLTWKDIPQLAEEAKPAEPPKPPEAAPEASKPPANAETPPAKSAPAAETEAPPTPAKDTAIAQREAAKVKSEIAKALGQPPSEASPAIDVTSTKEGVLISLTDTLDFGMFAVASAEPRPELVTLMEKIAEVLRDKPGHIVIRGHTDGRPYKSETYDNWRLSSARAQMAYYMLVRAGVDESRVDRIEGHADRELKLKTDPLAAENRRIEIMLRAEGE